jgi:transposase
MKQKYFIGIDISKQKLDLAIILSDFRIVDEQVIPNQQVKIKSFLKGFIKKHGIETENLLICVEHTGIYNSPLQRVCVELGIDLWQEHALKIKKASADLRGKSDRQDAIRIAEYSVRYQDRLILFTPPSKSIEELNTLNKTRETILAQAVAMKNQLNEAKTHDKESFKILSKIYLPIMKSIDGQLKKIAKRVNEILEENQDMKKNVELIKTIPGVGEQTAINMLVSTQNFTLFKSAKHLACYAGVVPFLNESGTIVKRARVSKMANQKLKKLLHLAAMAAIRTKSDLKAYYIRKVTEGKNKMSVLNAVRNKIVHRIWAVLQRQTPFVMENNFLMT